MPLFMDIHKVESEDFSVEDVIKAHMEDIAVQNKFGVRHKKYWVNVANKTIFCLMEGPSADACHAVHLEAHGQTACNMIEVFDDEFNMFLGTGIKNEYDLAQTPAGEVDTGYRTIILININEFPGSDAGVYTDIYAWIDQQEGTLIKLPNKDIMASFVAAPNAINCALEVDRILAAYQNAFEYRIAIITGKPVDEVGTDLFEETRKRLQNLCRIGLTKTKYTDEDTMLLARKNIGFDTTSLANFQVLNEADLNFLGQLFKILEKELDNPGFNVESLGSAMGLSKSQAYRKINTLTAMSPNALIQEVRLRQSLESLRQHQLSVSEVAYNCGFSSPTYFTRVFRKRFNILPKAYAKFPSA